MKQMKRLRQFCIAGVSVTLVTLVLVTSGLGAAAAKPTGWERALQIT